MPNFTPKWPAHKEPSKFGELQTSVIEQIKDRLDLLERARNGNLEVPPGRSDNHAGLEVTVEYQCDQIIRLVKEIRKGTF